MKTWKEDNLLHKSRKGIWKMNEKLIPASLERLNVELEKRPDFSKQMNTPLRNLNSQYLNLIDEEDFDYYKDNSLKDIIESKLSEGNKRGIYFYSEAGEDLEGFAYYTTSMNGLRVTDIGLFSFDVEKPNSVLVRDMLNLLKELREKYVSIEFMCVENNPVLDSYIKITRMFNGDYTYDEGIWYFEIPGKIKEKLKSIKERRK